MPVAIELTNCVVFGSGLLCGIIFVIYSAIKEKEAIKWENENWNTDFENPYK